MIPMSHQPCLQRAKLVPIPEHLRTKPLTLLAWWQKQYFEPVILARNAEVPEQTIIDMLCYQPVPPEYAKRVRNALSTLFEIPCTTFDIDICTENGTP